MCGSCSSPKSPPPRLPPLPADVTDDSTVAHGHKGLHTHCAKGSHTATGAAGRVGIPGSHRSNWSLHSITFSTADAAVSKESKQRTLSQMTWSMEQSKPTK